MPSLKSLSCLPGETGAELLTYGNLPEPKRVQQATIDRCNRDLAARKKFLDFETIKWSEYGNPITPLAGSPIGAAIGGTPVYLSGNWVSARPATGRYKIATDTVEAVPPHLVGEPPCPSIDAEVGAWRELFKWHQDRLGRNKYGWLLCNLKSSLDAPAGLHRRHFPTFLATLRQAT